MCVEHDYNTAIFSRQPRGAEADLVDYTFCGQASDRRNTCPGQGTLDILFVRRYGDNINDFLVLAGMVDRRASSTRSTSLTLKIMIHHYVER